MDPNEIFPNPLVKKVIFAIRFPNLFFLGDRIGDYQVKVMEKFPKSDLILQQSLLFTKTSDSDKLKQKVSEFKESDSDSRVWRFMTDFGMILDISSDSLSLVSENHKSFNCNDCSDNKCFREFIIFVTECFYDVMKIPAVKRIGLRYINECPVRDSSSKHFQEDYNTAFPLAQFPLEDATAMRFSTDINRDENAVRYVESLVCKDGKCNLTLDLDAFTREDCTFEEIPSIIDNLHNIIRDQFMKTIKQPVIDYMRSSPENNNVS